MTKAKPPEGPPAKPESDILRIQPYLGPPAETLSAPSLAPPVKLADFTTVAAPAFEHFEAKQASYLAASGSLIQFNAVMAAILVAGFGATQGPLSIAVSVALFMHVAAAFLLCWAARPIEDDKSINEEARSAREAFGDGLYRGFAVPALMERQLKLHLRRAGDTFRHYRRGWRMTLVALCASCAAVIVFVFQTIDWAGVMELVYGRL